MSFVKRWSNRLQRRVHIGGIPTTCAAPKVSLLRVMRAMVLPPLPAVGSVVGFSQIVPGMDGNDTVGDCDCVALTKLLRLQILVLTGVFIPDDSTAVQKLYNDFTGGQDVGCDPDKLMQYVIANGWTTNGQKLGIAQYADCGSAATWDDIKRAIVSLGGCMIGVTLKQSNMDQFDAHQPWDVAKGWRRWFDKTLGGHMVLGVAYDSTRKMYSVITWQTVQFATQAWLDAAGIVYQAAIPSGISSAKFDAAAWAAALAACGT